MTNATRRTRGGVALATRALSLAAGTAALGLALLAPGCRGGGDESGAESGARAPGDAPRADGTGSGAAGDRPGESAPRPAPAGRLAVDQRFPAVPVEALGHTESLLKAHAWTVVALAPAACGECEADVEEWVLQAGLWTSSRNLRATIVAEGTPESLGWLTDATTAPGAPRPFASASPLFRYTGELSRPTFVLVDTMGVVRHIARQSGTISERWRSLGRNYRYQSAPERVRVEVARRVFPRAETIRIVRTASIEPLARDLLRLGISPWFAVAENADGSLRGHAFPIERDTDCDTCDPLYLVVGVREGAVLRIEEIEPVISLGEREVTAPFFEALRGVASDDDVARVQPMLASSKADRAVREILSLALAAADRLTEARGGDGS